MTLPDITKLTIQELKSLRLDVDMQLKSLALTELADLESALNDLRELAGLKRKATSGALSEGRKKVNAAAFKRPKKGADQVLTGSEPATVTP